MPQYNSPTIGNATTVAAADTILFWKDALAGNQLITAQDFATGIKALMTFLSTVSILTANTTLTGAHDFVVANSGAGISLTLPAAASFPGKRYTIGTQGAGSTTMLRTGADTIAAGASGAVTSIAIAQYYSFDFVSDGVSTWYMVGKG